MYGRVTKIIRSVLEIYGQVLNRYGWVAFEKLQFSLARFYFLASEFSISH